MKFSLIVATINRSGELSRLFSSLKLQSSKDFEVIVVDQNADDRAAKTVEAFQAEIAIVHIRTSQTGLSRARNLGLPYARGEVIAFPDDDCWYTPSTLEFVAARFSTDANLDVLSGMSVDAKGHPSQGRWAQNELGVDRFSVWTCQTSYTTFYRASAIAKAGGFDPSLGVGSGTVWGAGEETDLLLRLIDRGATVRYDPNLRISHPEPLAIFDEKAFHRGRLYNRGFGRVLRLHNYPLWFVAYMIARPSIGAFVSTFCLNYPKAKYRWITSVYRIRGWRDVVRK